MAYYGMYNQRVGGSPKSQNWKMDGWAKGQNSFAEDNEIREDEFYKGENIEIQGRSSIRMPRRGHRLFVEKAGVSNFNGWGVYKEPNSGANYVIAMWDGHVYKITTGGVISEIDATKTWDDTARMRGILLREWFYFGNGVDYMAKTDGSTVVRWNTISTPTGLSLSHSTGAGANILWTYTISSVTANGETDSPTEVSIYAGELKDAAEEITVTWNRDPSSDVVGYNIFRARSGGTLYFLTRIDQKASGATQSWIDEGVEEPSLTHEAPTFNMTGGIKGNLFGKYANTLFEAGNLESLDSLFYGGTGSQWESFSPDANGGYIKIGRGDGDKITAMIGFEDYLFVFKENSISKFIFGSDGGPVVTSVIPQYGTSSPDSVVRFEKDILFYGTDGRYRILGYEPSQLNVIRTTDMSNRIQPDLDGLDATVQNNFHAAYFEQKYIFCDTESAYPYDRRYIGFLGRWKNYTFDSFLIWDKGAGKQLLFGAEHGTGKIQQLLVDGTYDDNGTTIPAYIRFKRVDGGDDTYLKFYRFSKAKLKNPRGIMEFGTYKDGDSLVDSIIVPFNVGGGIDEYMFDEAMFDESIAVLDVSDSIKILMKELYFEAYSIYHDITVNGNSENHCIVQTMNGYLESEDSDYTRDETII